MKKFSICLALLFVSFVISPLNGEEGDALEVLKKTSQGFSSVAKKATPAVVFIESKVEAATHGHDQRRHPRESEDPFDFFRDEFFRHFFRGAPGAPGGGHGYPPPAYNEPAIGRGSGFVVSADGLIITNNHVVRDAASIMVSFEDGRKLEAKVLGSDPGTDVALIKVDAEELDFLTFGDSDSLDIGDWAIAIGSPLGLRASLTVGVVSAKGRDNLQLTDFDDFIQTDAAINPGNSGGPLLNLDGEVIGVNTAIVTKSGGYMGIGFAIPSAMVKHVMDQLLASGAVTRGFLGIAPQDLDSELAESFNLEKVEGVLIAQVVKESPAEVGGLKSGDVVLKINNINMKNVTTLRKTVALMEPGTEVALVVFREGETFETTVTIGTHPQSPSQEMDFLFDKIGVGVGDLLPEKASELGYEEDRGVIVERVAARSPAAEAGIRPGDLIMAVDRKEVESLPDFVTAIKKAMEDERVLLLVKQGRAMRFITLRIN